MNPFDVGNAICLVGTLLLIHTVIKDRKTLKGYSFIGALLIFLSLLFFILGFVNTRLYFSAVSAVITDVYWLFVTIYTGMKRNEHADRV